MPGLTDFSENTVLDDMVNAGSGFAIAGDPWILLHTGDPGENGTTNASAHARVQAAFNASASGLADNTADVDFTSMPAETIFAWSIWDASTAGNCLQTGWFSTVSGLAVVRTADLTADDVQTNAHGLVADDRVVFETIEGLTAPTGMTLNTAYYVIATGLTTDAFRFSATSGGAAVNMTAVGSAVWRKVTPKVVNSGDTFRISAGALDLIATE